MPQLTPSLFNGHYYQVVSDTLNWDDASEVAQQMSYNGVRGHLVTVTSKAERDFVSTLVSGSTSGYWIGADNRASNTWMWVSDRPRNRQAVAPFYWAAAQPDGGDCLEQHADGGWKDESCGTTQKYIVEFGNDPEPEHERTLISCMLCLLDLH